MLLKLSGPGLEPLSACSANAFIGRVTTRTDLPIDQREREILRANQPLSELPPGFRAYLLDEASGISLTSERDVFVLRPEWRYLAEGDVVRLDPLRRTVATLYRRNSRSNTFLVTERCDNYCVMCSQPPKSRDDGWLVDELLEVIPLISQETEEIGITGGEPALLGARLLQLITLMKQYLPTTAVHILSNGRAFRASEFAQLLAQLQHPDLMLGIPLYSDVAEEHDYVVQAKGAFEDTVRGILNLKECRVRVELRFVIHADTHQRMASYARFVARNLCFVDHVALMGLEPVGFAKANLASLWCDPVDYQVQLAEAVQTLHRAGIPTSIYNHPLCVLPSALHPFARKSISDWKNTFVAECSRCARQSDCAGFFASATLKRSRDIRPFDG